MYYIYIYIYTHWETKYVQLTNPLTHWSSLLISQLRQPHCGACGASGDGNGLRGVARWQRRELSWVLRCFCGVFVVLRWLKVGFVVVSGFPSVNFLMFLHIWGGFLGFLWLFVIAWALLNGLLKGSLKSQLKRPFRSHRQIGWKRLEVSWVKNPFGP